MFARFASTDDRSVANELVRACVVGPEALPDMACLLPVARLAATWHHGNVRLVGAALYRAGEYQQAMHCMAESDRLLRPSAWEYCFRAMIHQRLGNRDEARRFLAEAEAWIAAANQRLGDDITGDGPSWYGEGQFIETYALLPEARKVVSGTLSRADADGGPRRGE